MQHLFFELRGLKRKDPTETFSPITIAVRAYVQRSSLEQQLQRALLYPGKQVLLYGEPRVGKRSLLNQVLTRENYQKITSTCSSGMALSDLMEDAADQAGYMEVVSINEKKSSSDELGGKAKGLFLEGSYKTQVSEESTSTSEKPVRGKLSFSRLVRILHRKKLLWVIENAYNLSSSEYNGLRELMGLFADMANDCPDTKLIITGNEAIRDIFCTDNQLDRWMALIAVPLMTDLEIAQIPIIGGDDLKIHFDDKTLAGFNAYSKGNPALCHELCLEACLDAKIKGTWSFSRRELSFNTESYLSDIVSHRVVPGRILQT